MEPGRTVQMITVQGKPTAKTLGKSWKGDPNDPVANTNSPVYVHDESKSGLQHVKQVEALRLMGFPDRYLPPDIPEIEGLRLVGQSMDINVMDRFFISYYLFKRGGEDIASIVQILSSKEAGDPIEPGDIDYERLHNAVHVALLTLFGFGTEQAAGDQYLALRATEKRVCFEVVKSHSVHMKVNP